MNKKAFIFSLIIVAIFVMEYALFGFSALQSKKGYLFVCARGPIETIDGSEVFMMVIPEKHECLGATSWLLEAERLKN